MIYTPATVYYRLETVRGYHLFVFLTLSFFLFPIALVYAPLTFSVRDPLSTSRVYVRNRNDVPAFSCPSRIADACALPLCKNCPLSFARAIVSPMKE